MKRKKIDVAEPDEPEGTQVVDLIARLQESLQRSRKRAAGRSMREACQAGKALRKQPESARRGVNRHDTAIAPMLASVRRGPPRGAGWVFEPKYDGIRASLAYAEREGVALIKSKRHRQSTVRFPRSSTR